MNWKIGSFRLWILCLIVWVLFTGLVLGLDEFNGLWKPASKFRILYNGKEVSTVDGSLPAELMRQRIINEVLNEMDRKILRTDDPEAKKQIVDATEIADTLLKGIQKDQEAERARLSSALKFLLIPPTSLLIFGFLIGWVVNGFRKAKS